MKQGRDCLMSPPEGVDSGGPASGSDTRRESRSPPGGASVPTRKVPLPPDGGWGWVIVFCCFLCNGIVDGLCSSMGVFQPHFVEHFGASRAKTAMVVSLMTGFFMIVGPLSSALVNVLGCRIVTIAGGVLTTTALLLSTFSTSVDMLIVTCGALGGLGLGLIYLPAMVMVGYYFERRRAVATGIACSGAGVGILILAFAASALLHHFDWRHALMIMAGFPMQCLLLGGLMRPIDYGARRPADDSEVNLMTNSPSAEEVFDAAQSPQESNNRSIGELRESTQPRIYRSYDLSLKSRDGRNGVDNGCTQNGRLKNELLKDRLLAGEDVTSSCHEISAKSRDRSNLQTKTFLHPGHRDGNRARSCHNLSQHTKDDAEPATRHRTGRLHRKELDKPLLRKDIFYSGSIYNLPEYKSNPSLHSYLASITKLPTAEELSGGGASESPCSCLSQSTTETLKEMLDFGICTDPYFLILAAGSLFIQLAYYAPIMFIGEYAMSLGISPGQAASLISVMGIGNTLGRAISGALANIPGVPVLHLNNLTLVAAGLATVLVTFVCKDYPSLVAYAVVYGLGLGAFIPLGVIFLVKYLGLHRLTNAFGLMSLVRGASSMVGPPIAGGLLDATHDYSVAFLFAGAMLVTAGLVHYLLPVVQRWKSRPRADPPSFSTLVVATETQAKEALDDGVIA